MPGSVHKVGLFSICKFLVACILVHFIMEALKAQISVSKRNHTRLCDKIQKTLAGKIYENEIVQNQKRLIECHQSLMSDYTKMLVLSGAEDTGELDSYQENYENALDEIFDRFPSLSITSKPSKPASANIKLRVPDMKPFSNNIRDYPVFKSTFKNHYERSYGEHAALVLKQNLLVDYSKKLCQPAESVDEVFRLLDSIYGDEGRLAESVMSDLDKLPTCSLSLTSLKSLRDTIRLAQSDLSAVKLAHLIESYQTVMLVVKKLPEEVHRRWAETVVRESIHTYDRFHRLMEFLDAEIRTLELMQPAAGHHGNGSSGHHGNGSSGHHGNGSSGSHGHGGSPGSSGHVKAGQTGTGAGNENGQDTSESRTRICPLHKVNSNHDFGYCRLFRRWSTKDKVKFLKGPEGSKFCRSCLRDDHPSGINCPVKLPACKKDDCKRHHLTFMHAACEELRSGDKRPHSYGAHCALAESNKPNSISSSAISPMQRVRVSINGYSGYLNTLWDTGSNLSLVTRHMCTEYGFEQLDEDSSSLTIETVGGNILSKQTQRYKIPLCDQNRDYVTTVVAYAVDQIGSIPPTDLSSAYDVFGLKGEDRNQAIYPDGEIHLLLGCDNSHLILENVCQIDGLRLSESPLGKVIWGKHPSFSSQHNCKVVIARLATPDHVFSAQRHLSLDKSMDYDVKSLFATETMGVSCNPKCGRCACGKCSITDDTMTQQERFEFETIKSSIVVENREITASYPYRKNLKDLPDNYNLAYKRLCQIEQKLAKNPSLSEMYQSQFDDMLARGKLRRLLPEEKLAWGGAVQYLPHNYVLKTNSTSTPCRLILDPSSPYKGHAVNDYWGRGPNLVNSAFGVLLRFCEYPVAFFADISKMYQTVSIREPEQHLHRILWRDMQTDREPDIYLVTCNSFGSGPAGAVAIAALQHVAEMKRDEFPEAAHTIIKQSYVDDIMGSTTDLQTAERLSREIDEILDVGGFKVKKWTFVDSSNLPESAESVDDLRIDADENSVLGQRYDTSTDEFYFKAHLNFSKKRRGVRTGPDLSKDSVFDTKVLPYLTKRMILSQVHSIYDPNGYLGPFIVELKFAMGKLWRYRSESGEELGWDDRIPADHEAHWRKLFELFYEIGQIRVSRCLRPALAIGSPILVMFSDSSMIAFGTCAFVRWEMSDGLYFSKLIASKSRMWPINPEDYISVCRGELQGAVLASRLSDSVTKFSSFDFHEILYVVDSEIVLAQIKMDSHLLSTYVGPRVAEIKSVTKDKGQWWFVPGTSNTCADLLSRGTTDFDLLSKDSTWQTGPEWLHLPRDDWPVTQKRSMSTPVPEVRIDDLKHRTMMVQNTSVSTDEPSIPGISALVLQTIQQLGENPVSSSTMDDIEVEIKQFTDEQRKYIASLIDLKRHDDFELWLAVTFRILHALSWKRGDGSILHRFLYPPVVLPAQRHLAKVFWIQDAQKSLQQQIRRGQLKTLTPFPDSEGIIRCNARSGATSGYQPILLPYNHPISRLIVIYFHKRGHGGATATAARVRSEFHILQLRKLAMSVRNDCHLCKLVEKKLMKVPMGSLPASRLTPSLPFEHCSCDIFGPYHVQLIGKFTRNRKIDPAYYKAYGLIITCLSTRAVHLELMHGQNTDAFLLAFRRFVCLRGQPKSMYSDNGGQLIAADDELKAIVDSFDHKKLQQYGAVNGMTWQYCAPGSPYQNAVSEALIRSVKTTLRTITTPTQKLPVTELQTILYEVAELLNERPINLGHQGASGHDYDADTNTYLCPNQLLLGRSTPRVPQGPFDPVESSSSDRLLAVQTIVTDWWDRWIKLYFPTLIHQSKWFKDDRKPHIGDVVFIKDLNPIRGHWNLGEIVSLGDKDSKNIINVQVRYRNANTKTDRVVWRDVRNLSVIVPNELRVVKSKLNPTAPKFLPAQ